MTRTGIEGKLLNGAADIAKVSARRKVVEAWRKIVHEASHYLAGWRLQEFKSKLPELRRNLVAQVASWDEELAELR